MWVATQTRPDIANAVWAIAPFLHDPKPIHCQATQKILEYLNTTSDLGLTFRRDDNLGSVHLGFDLETHVDADYAHKTESRCPVSGVAICCGGTLVSWLSRTCHSIYHGGEMRSRGRRGHRGIIYEGDSGVSGVSDAQSRADEHWRVRGQQGGDRLGEKKLEFIQQQAH